MKYKIEISVAKYQFSENINTGKVSINYIKPGLNWSKYKSSKRFDMLLITHPVCVETKFSFTM